MDKKKILIINQGKSDNLGDKAIANTMINTFKNLGCEVDFCGFSQCVEQTIGNLEYESNKFLFRKKIAKFIPNIFKFLFFKKKKIAREFNKICENKYDLIIYGGGQLIKTKTVFLYSLLYWKFLCNKFKAKQIMFGVGADSNFKIYEKILYKNLLHKFDRIYVRDEFSKEIIEEIFENSCENVLPDIVFMHNASDIIKKENLIVLMVYDYETAKRHFGIKKTREEYYESFLAEMKKNIPFLSCKVVLAYTTFQDKIETLKFREYLQIKGIDYEFVETDTLDQFEKLLSSADYIISARMHALILGMIYKCEVIPYIISPKVKAFSDEYINSDYSLLEMKNMIMKDIENILQWINEEKYGKERLVEFL